MVTPTAPDAAYTDDPSIAATEPRLEAVQAELMAREPVFHRPEQGTDRRALESMTVEDFWEVGASGRRYGRRYVIDTLLERYTHPVEDIWRTSDFRCREIAPDTYLLTYELLQDGTRRTRRATIWRRARSGWQIVYHQGTVVESVGESAADSRSRTALVSPMHPVIVIRTPRLQLVEVRPDDAAELFDAITPAVARFMAWEPPASSAILRARLEACARDTGAHGLSFVVRRLDDGKCLGKAGVEDPHAKHPEIGLWLRESAQGRGYGTEAVRALVDRAGRELDRTAFTWPVAVDNLASRRLAERLGGRIVGTRSGPKYDSVVYRVPISTVTGAGSA